MGERPLPLRILEQFPRDRALLEQLTPANVKPALLLQTHISGRGDKGVGTGEQVPLAEQWAARWALVGAESRQA